MAKEMLCQWEHINQAMIKTGTKIIKLWNCKISYLSDFKLGYSKQFKVHIYKPVLQKTHLVILFQQTQGIDKRPGPWQRLHFYLIQCFSAWKYFETVFPTLTFTQFLPYKIPKCIAENDVI